MQKEIIISDDEYESRCAILEDGVLSEIDIERKDDKQTLSNIYKGRVESVLPGMQIAFVDIGLERHAFLHVSDIRYDSLDDDVLDRASVKLDLNSETPRPNRAGRGGPYSISDLIHKGQDILVQVTKEPIGTKGSRVTTGITLAGRYVVYLPNSSNIGISRRISSEDERQRLKTIAQELRADVQGGFIIRTAAEGQSEKEFATEIPYLINLWKEIGERSQKMPVPSLVHKDLGFIGRVMRDFLTSEVTDFVIDSKEIYQEALEYLSSTLPEFRSRVKLYEESVPIFDAYNIEKELKRALSEKVWLNCGGYIVIQQTEAMFSIDVNTGRFVGKTDPDNTILSANLEAVEEVVRQIRLRGIGGIIVIDFIDMDHAEHRKRVFTLFQEALKKDRARTNILHFSELGLLEMTRQRTRPSLLTLLTETCPYCDGYGTILSEETVTISLLRLIKRAYRKSRQRRLTVVANPIIVSHLLEVRAEKLSQLENSMNLKIRIEEDADLHLEDYRIFVGDSNREINLN